MNVRPSTVFRRRQAFTLIELLVVVAIVAILSTISMSQVNMARIKARDAKRMTDFQTMAQAINLYIAENSVPPDDRTWTGHCVGAVCMQYSDSTTPPFLSFLSAYLPYPPVDPINKTSQNRYEYYKDHLGSLCGTYSGVNQSIPQYADYGYLIVNLENSMTGLGNYVPGECNGSSQVANWVRSSKKAVWIFKPS